MKSLGVQKRSRWIGFCPKAWITGAVIIFWSLPSLGLPIDFPKANSPIQTPHQIADFATPTNGSSCAKLTNPLTPEEEKYARTAWQYFVKNYQPATGFTNSTGGYPSGTLWDMGNYLMALNAARWMNLIPQAEFDSKLNKFLDSLGKLRLFENSLPNKVYNAANGQLVDYTNKVVDRGIGWSALDIGRILAAFHVLRTCNPQYADWIKSIVGRWALQRSVKDGELYGTAVLPDGRTLPVQEGRLGYEEYAARGYELWGYSATKALSLNPFQMVEIYGVKLPVDTRSYQKTNANNYVVSESYILDGIEFGFLGDQMKQYAQDVLEVQRRRYLATGQLTAVTEDNIDGPPYFLYNTIFANGNAWATITEKNEPYTQLRSISTKAAFGWRYIYPDNPYAQQLFEVAKTLVSPDGAGFYAGLYEETKQPNKVLTGNTNGLIMEILYYKARGYQPMIGGQKVTASTGKPENTITLENYPPPKNLQSPASGSANASASQTLPSPPSLPASASTPIATASTPQGTTPNFSPTSPNATGNVTGASSAAAAIPPIDRGTGTVEALCSRQVEPLTIPERRYAQAAWAYFKTNYNSATGLVADRNDLEGATLWGMGDYLTATHAALSLNLITINEFDDRTRRFLGALSRLPLFDGELPQRVYGIKTLQPVDYGTNPISEGQGWSSVDIGRLMVALYQLKSCYPIYGESIDKILLQWSYLRIVRNGQLYDSVTEKDQFGRRLTRVRPATQLGYAEYAARGFQLWGFSVDRTAISNNYATVNVNGFPIPTQRINGDRPGTETSNPIVSDPFVRYALELGIDPLMKGWIEPIFQAQASRYNKDRILTAAAVNRITFKPYILKSTIFGNDHPWSVLQDDGTPSTEHRIVSSAMAFAFYALFPHQDYAETLWRSVTDLYNPSLGYYEGFDEQTGSPSLGFSSSTNSVILQALLYQHSSQKPLVSLNTSGNSPWNKAIEMGNSGNGLPDSLAPQIRLVNTPQNTYWISVKAQLPIVTPPIVPMAPVVSPTPQSSNPSINSSTLNPTPNPTPNPSPSPPSNPSAEHTPSAPAAVSSTSWLTNPHAVPAHALNEDDRTAAKRAWAYFEKNWNPQTGLVNAVENYPWTTLWDQGSAILGLYAAYQLGMLPIDRFQGMMGRLLQTLETLPLSSMGLPNKAYSTIAATPRTLDNQPDPQSRSGWSALDLARCLAGLAVVKANLPNYQDSIDRIVHRWRLTQLVKEGRLAGGVPNSNGQITVVQEGRLGYEQYAAEILKRWGIHADLALNQPLIEMKTLDGISIAVDQRNLSNSGASNHLTSDPYLFWGLELGWSPSAQTQAERLFQLQKQRFEKTKILTAVNEDSIDREPYFIYYNIYANGQFWTPINSQGKAFPSLKFISTKAAFGWSILIADDPYALTLRQGVQNLADNNRGYLAGRYDNPQLGTNAVLNVNTNGAVLESLLYSIRGGIPLIQSQRATSP